MPAFGSTLAQGARFAGFAGIVAVATMKRARKQVDASPVARRQPGVAHESARAVVARG